MREKNDCLLIPIIDSDRWFDTNLTRVVGMFRAEECSLIVPTYSGDHSLLRIVAIIPFAL